MLITNSAMSWFKTEVKDLSLTSVRTYKKTFITDAGVSIDNSQISRLLFEYSQKIGLLKRCGRGCNMKDWE